MARPCGGDTAGCQDVGVLVLRAHPLEHDPPVVQRGVRPKAGGDTCPRFVHRIFLEFSG